MLFLSLAGAVLLPTALAAPKALKYVTRQDNCTTTGVHIIAARASTESVGTGIIGQVATMIEEGLPGSDVVAVDYPATLTDYVNSQSAGVTAMTSLIEEYVDACPESKIVLLGYSQGAHVVGDVLYGTSETGWNTTTPLATKYGEQIAAVVQMGDPSHMAGESYDAGTSTRDGIFPRLDMSATSTYASRLISYCDAEDKYCDSGDQTIPHLMYVPVYGEAAAQFVISKVSE